MMSRCLIPEVIHKCIAAGAAADIETTVVDRSGKKIPLDNATVTVGLSVNQTTEPYEFLSFVVAGSKIVIPITKAKTTENSGKCRFLSCWVEIDDNPSPALLMWLDFKRSTRG